MPEDRRATYSQTFKSPEDLIAILPGVLKEANALRDHKVEWHFKEPTENDPEGCIWFSWEVAHAA
jgi:hypothetical protein